MKNLYPKIVFKYSWIYDEIWKNGLIIKKTKKYPSTREILNYIKRIGRLWQREEKKVLRELAKITYLKWKSKFIYCYVVGKCKPFSDPLTLPIYKRDLECFIDVLIHELIHNLFLQEGNYEKSKKAWAYFKKRYKSESKKTRIHIPLYAVHSHIYHKFYDGKRLERDVKKTYPYKDYRRAWKIVQNEGYKNIINEFVKRIKR